MSLASRLQIFVDAGYSPDEAAIRGNILYFTQIGYYVLDLGESGAERLRRMAGYYLAYTGRPLSEAGLARFRAGRRRR